ncbi:hypothetical protein ACNRWW_15280 [Metabacillus sp. HB246100]
MHLYVFILVGFLILIPIVLLVPIGLNKTGKIVLSLIAFLSTIVFTFTSKVIPIWQSGVAIFLLLCATAYLLRNKANLFEELVTEEIHEENVIAEEWNEPLLTVEDREPEINHADVLERHQGETQEWSVDASEVNHDDKEVFVEEENKEQQEQSFLDDFFDSIDSQPVSEDELSGKNQMIEEVAVAIESNEMNEPVTNDNQETTDDFLFELFEGRDQDQNTEQENQKEEPETMELDYLEDLLESESVNREERKTLDLEIVPVEEIASDEENQVESMMKVKQEQEEPEVQALKVEQQEQLIEEQMVMEEKALENGSEYSDFQESLVEEAYVEHTEPQQDQLIRNEELPNDVLDLLLDQMSIYKNTLSPQQYEKVLIETVNNAKSEKDTFLFARELLYYYVETGKELEYELFLQEMKDALTKYPLLFEQLLWIKQK